MPPKKAQAARKAPAAGGKKRLTFADEAADEASKAVQTTRHVKFSGAPKAGAGAGAGAAAATPALKRGSGIVTAAREKKRPRGDDDDSEEDDKEEDDDVSSLVDSSGDDEEEEADAAAAGASDDDLSDLTDAESDDDNDDADNVDSDDENPFAHAKRTGKKLSFSALRLRFLPAAFEEPQLFKFLSQFGAEVLNCFCVRSRRTHQSKGIAYVQFDRDTVLPLVVEECNGMALGGRAVRARMVTLHRAMPSKEKVSKRRRLAYSYKTKGAPLKHHNVLAKNPVALLIKAARTEVANNAYLKSIGVNHCTTFFIDQLSAVPPHLITKNTKILADAGAVAGPAPAKEREETAAATPAKASPAKAAKAAKAAAATPSPKKTAAAAAATTTPSKAAAAPAPAAAPAAAAATTTPSKAAASPSKKAPAKSAAKKAPVVAPAKKAAVKAAPKKAAAPKAAPKKAPAKAAAKAKAGKR